MNDAFIIDQQTKEKLIAEDPRSAEIIRPILRGKDIKRYGYDFKQTYLIVTHNGNKIKGIPPVNINDYPAVKKHLEKYLDKLEKRQDRGDTPYNLRNCVYMDEFSKPKIIYREISQNMDACYVQKEFYVNNKCYIITGDHLLYLLGYLNSRIFNYLILPEANMTGGKGKDFLDKIFIPNVDLKTEKQITELVSKMQDEHDSGMAKNLDVNIEDAIFNILRLNKDEASYIFSKDSK